MQAITQFHKKHTHARTDVAKNSHEQKKNELVATLLMESERKNPESISGSENQYLSAPVTPHSSTHKKTVLMKWESKH
jgi:uncharacterized protein YjaZ